MGVGSTAEALLVNVGGTADGVTVGSEFVVVAGNPVGVGGPMVGTTVGGGLVGVITVTISVGDTAVDNDASFGVDAHAATNTVKKMSTTI